MKAIIYMSNTGTTKEYADLLGKKTGLPVYNMEHSSGVEKGCDIIYLGWVMASSIKGYNDAVKKWNIRAVCGICMGETGSQIKELRDKNSIPETMPLFTMQGGFDIHKLHGKYKLMMKVMSKTIGKMLDKKPDKTPEEEKTYEMMVHGGSYVSAENMKQILEWYEAYFA
ncbi:MAG: hypothetical protein PHD56_03910 [Anaerostipes sp.]|nr:hypothetical protein [Anaerostipes sp.]